MFVQLLRVTIEVMLLRRGPQDMPSDWGLLAGLGGVYCIVSCAQVLAVSSAGSAILQAVLATVLLVFYVRALLRLRGHPERLVQTLVALFACGSVLTLLLLGPTALLAPTLHAMAASQQAGTVAAPPTLAALMYMVVGFWGLFVFGHIYRNALGVSYFLGICAALGFELVLVFFVSGIGALL